jgi:hypothetical protein
MEQFVAEIIKISPAVAILLFLVVRQDRRNEKLVDTIVECFRECEERIDAANEEDERRR